MYSPEQSSPSGFSNSWGARGKEREHQERGAERPMSCPNCLPTAHRLVPQIPSPISVGVRIPSPQVWECSGTSCPFCGWGLSPQVSPRAPHLETNITPFATQTSKKEEDEGQQTGAGNEDYSVGRSQRGSAQSESICGHKAGLGSGIPDTDYRTLYPSHPGPVLDYNSHDAQHPETPLGREAGWPNVLWEL